MRIGIVALLVLGAVGALSAEELTPGERMAQAIFVSERPLPPPSSEHYAEVMGILRAAAKGQQRILGASLLSQKSALFVLINAGDQPAIDYFMDAFLRSQGKVHFAFDVFRRAKQPLLIPHLVKGLGDTRYSSQVVEGDIVYGSLPGMSARGILHILSNSNVFPFLTRATASHYLRHLPTDDKLAAGLKEWWAANEKHFAEAAYAKVMPLPEIEVLK